MLRALVTQAEKHGKDGTWPRTTAHAVNPGLTNTSITRELSAFAKAAYFGGVARRSVAYGAATTLYCCISKAHDLVLGGRYYENCEEVLSWPLISFVLEFSIVLNGSQVSEFPEQVLLWDELEDEGGDKATEGETGEQSENSIERGGVDETLELDAEDETSLEAAARLWALSEWMVQPNSTYHDAHSGLFSVYEEPEEEVLEKVFGYEVVAPATTGDGDDDGESNSAAFGEAAGEWQEAQFDPTAAQRAAAEAAAARKAVGRGGPSSRRREKQTVCHTNTSSVAASFLIQIQ